MSQFYQRQEPPPSREGRQETQQRQGQGVPVPGDTWPALWEVGMDWAGSLNVSLGEHLPPSRNPPALFSSSLLLSPVHNVQYEKEAGREIEEAGQKGRKRRPSESRGAPYSETRIRGPIWELHGVYCSMMFTACMKGAV